MTKTSLAVLQSYQARLVPLEQNLTAAVFPFMKIFPAEFCVRQAREKGMLPQIRTEYNLRTIFAIERHFPFKIQTLGRACGGSGFADPLILKPFQIPATRSHR